MKVMLVDVYDDEGNMARIEAINCETGEMELQFLWDPRDEQTPENRTEFRDWAGQFLTRKEYTISNA